MSNPLSVRRVKVQTIDERGNPVGEPTYGVMASDSYGQTYNDTYESLDALNDAIETAGCILFVAELDHTVFPDADPRKIGTKNFYGKDWS